MVIPGGPTHLRESMIRTMLTRTVTVIAHLRAHLHGRLLILSLILVQQACPEPPGPGPRAFLRVKCSPIPEVRVFGRQSGRESPIPDSAKIGSL
jgi:hypothetical protein